MAQINGSSSKNNYGFYAILTEEIPSDYLSTNKTILKYEVYIQNNGTRFNSNNWIKYVQIDGVDALRQTGQTINSTTVGYSSSMLVMSGSKEITHNDDGAKTITFTAGLEKSTSYSTYDPGKCSLSGTFTLTTIPRKSSVSGGSGNIGGIAQITINRLSSNFTHTLKYSFGSLTGTIATGVGSSYNWTIPTSFYTQIPNSNSGTGTITCETYSGTKLVGSSTCSFTAKVTNSNPSFTSSNISYLDSNTIITAITGNNQHIVRNQSNLKVTFTAATGKNSATISKYEITLNGSTQTKTAASTIDYGKLNVSSNVTVSIKVTDSRGNTTTATKTITILDWILPSASILLTRLNNYEDETYLKVTGKISSVNSKNAIKSIVYRCKKVSDSTYSNNISLTNNQQVTISQDKSYAWNFQIVISDKFGTTTYNLILPKGQPILFVDTKKLSVGVNRFPSQNKSFEIDGDLYMIDDDETLIPIIYK